LKLAMWIISLPVIGASAVYICGSDELSPLNGVWLTEHPTPVFLQDSVVERQFRHRCIILTGMCNAAVLRLPQVAGGCDEHWTIVERNRANPPKNAILAETSGDIRNIAQAVNAIWKDTGKGKIGVFLDETDCSAVQWQTTLGCDVALLAPLVRSVEFWEVNPCTNDLCCRPFCRERYQLSTEARFICNSAGKWIAEKPIKCTPFSCDTFPHLATFTEWHSGTMARLVHDALVLRSGESMEPLCTDGTLIGKFTCDRGQLLLPYPYCIANSLDIISSIAVLARASALTEDELTTALGSDGNEEVRILARENDSMYISVTPPRPAYVDAQPHPAYALHHRLTLNAAFRDLSIAWNFSFP